MSAPRADQRAVQRATGLLDRPIWAAPPGEIRGFNRLTRIIYRYPVAPLELIFGLTAVVRGGYILNPDHAPARTPAWDVLVQYGLGITVLAATYTACGVLQLLATCYEWERARLVAAAALCGLTTWLIYAFVTVEHNYWGWALYLPMWLGQLWIAMRSVPLFAPRENGDAGA